MLAISIELLHGTFRGDPDGTANTGRLTRGEWPPSPARLFAAFVAADGTRGQCRVTDGTELTWFEKLPPPEIRAHPRPCHQSLLSRYVVEHTGSPSKSHHLEYVSRKGVLIRPGVRVSPRHPDIHYVWNVETPAPSLVDALRRRAARIGYLGCADSPVRVRVLTELPQTKYPYDAFIPDKQGDTVINVAKTGDLELLDWIYDQWTTRGASMARKQFPVHREWYRSPGSAEVVDNGRVVIWLRLRTAVSGRRITVVTQLFKNAVLSRHQEIHGEPPAVLHGHGLTEKGYDLARYLALPDVGFPRSRGRIHGLALWMLPGCDEEVYQMADDAAREVRELRGYGVHVEVVPWDGGSRPRATHPGRWLKPAQGWVTAFPAIHERRRKLDLNEVTRWCKHAGLPAPVAVRSARTPLVSGALDLMPVEVNRPNRPRLPYSHVELRFSEAVEGPVVIGSGRQRGFGLCVQVSS